ncbi:MAG TPA: hypothetical protein VLX92_07215 [Kofleriaceae bacterium]|nr:hypothetical protein [Kofleriaceae bacterium]
MNRAAVRPVASYTVSVELTVLLVLAAVVAVVAIDVVARRPPRQQPRDETLISTQKIIVDLSRRR